MLRTLKSLLILALLATPALAQAEEPTKTYPDCGREPTDAEVAAAKGAFQAGNASFNEADYTRAIDYWEDAYRRDCTANPLLLNLARAYELAGRKRQAVVALETFLAREPNTGEKDQITRRIEVLKKKIAEEDAAAAALPPPPPTGKAATNPNDAPVAPEQPKARRSAGPWIVIGVGGAAALVGVVGLGTNKKKLDDASAICPDRDKCNDAQVREDGNAARAGMNASGALLGVGLAAVAGGVVWYVLDGNRVAQANSASATLVPVVGPKLAGLSWSGSF
jgi:tetratricopeptide (TPR) repeat protein